MGDFVKVADLQLHLGETFDTTQQQAADKAIKRVEGLVRAFCGWHISEQAGAVHTVDGPADVDLFLPTMRLTAVTSVVENGQTLVVDTSYRWLSNGTVTRRGMSRWYDGFQSVVVTFDHGYARTDPEFLAVADVVLTAVTRRRDNPAGRRQETTGGLSDVYAIPSSGLVPAGLLYSEQEALAAAGVVLQSVG